MKYDEWKAAYVDKTEKPRTAVNAKLTKTSGADTIETGGEGILNILPNADKAVIPIEKFTQYALNPDQQPNKAIAFELALGYNQSNYEDLVDNIRANLPNFPAKIKGNRGFGDMYEVVLKLTGANGKTAKVLTGWINDAALDEMRLTSVYVDK